MRQWFQENCRPLVLLILCSGIFALVFALYDLPIGAVIYPCLLCAGILLLSGIRRLILSRRKHRTLEALAALPDSLLHQLEAFDTQADRDYHGIIAALSRREEARAGEISRKLSDSMDYYTTWVHQIKTPIASMRLLLEKEDSPVSRQLSEELFRVEQYVQMVMTYQRLDSDSTDYVFRQTDVDAVVRGAIRKFAPQFISKGIRLDYVPRQTLVVTDEKWLSFVIEQLLSNAIKYTPAGCITIRFQDNNDLTITDTGIGIAPEDLPRIFERGYTGYNGRTDKRASGLGLYLCRRICDALGHGISIRSTPGVGTTVTISLSQKEQIFE